MSSTQAVQAQCGVEERVLEIAGNCWTVLCVSYVTMPKENNIQSDGSTVSHMYPDNEMLMNEN